ncbi:CoA-transferase subunit beta [Thermoactinomyces mirandus]|uniref:CoA-transferase n=1 Tax=Thermoactinomyces mirandus TaxID=2756294 RepID=A0A7W1XV34_9BACL|nr:CoA-transferase [Thermoactinomyces mirandus]MBA4603828.1 CoA-transferase [Thermoactinomyces mirandus]
MDYTAEELMVIAAAREIRDGDVVFVGMRLPMLAFAVAKKLHAPSAIGFFECGIVRDNPAGELLYTMGDPPNVTGAQWCTSTNNLMFLMHKGLVDVGFIGGAEIDKYGNINTSCLGPVDAPTVKLPGSGGAADIASLSRRLLAIMNHEKRRMREKVDYITSPGYGDGNGWREKAGLPRGGLSALITNLGVLRPDPETKELMLATVHPGVTVEEVRKNTDWELKLSGMLEETPTPSEQELEVLHQIDPQGFWTGNRERKKK